jgi:hypothetical protein
LLAIQLHWLIEIIPMPSLIYITRIRPLSAGLAHGLESAGLHVKSFGPGEITADECVLIMTSEAALAGLQVSGLASLTGGDVARREKSQATPPLQDIQKHLGAEAAVWNCIKAAELGESAVGESTAVSGRPPAAVPTDTAADDNPGFVPSRTGPQLLTSPQQRPTAHPQVVAAAQKRAPASNGTSGVPLLTLPPMGRVKGEPRQVATLPLKKTGVSDWIRSANGKPHKRFWQAAGMASALLMLAMVLLAGRESIVPDAAVSDHESLTSNQAGASNKGPTLADGHRHKSDYDFVAEDYTTHFDSQGHPRATLQTHDFRSGAQNRPIPKRVVVD